MADEVEKVKRAAAATISKLTDEKAQLTEQLRALQRAVSESQRVAAEAAEQADKLRGELAAEKQVSSSVESRGADKMAALERAAKAEKEKAAAAELAHHTALVAAAQAAAAQERRLQEEVAAVRQQLAQEQERVAELQRSVEHLTRAGEEAKELWARLKQALLVRTHTRSALPRRGCGGQVDPLSVGTSPAQDRACRPRRAPLTPSRTQTTRLRRCGTRRWVL
jgi:chromosome segregation ATPase